MQVVMTLPAMAQNSKGREWVRWEGALNSSCAVEKSSRMPRPAHWSLMSESCFREAVWGISAALRQLNVVRWVCSVEREMLKMQKMRRDH